LERRTVQIEDIRADPEFDLKNTAGVARTVLGVPLMVMDDIKGILLVRRAEPRPFTQAHTRIVETFARQAAIAMENARLFSETKEGLERQTAVAEVLRSIAGSPTDVAPVLATNAPPRAVTAGCWLPRSCAKARPSARSSCERATHRDSLLDRSSSSKHSPTRP